MPYLRFEESEGPIDFIANRDTPFVLGFAILHPHDLVTSFYSVHTNRNALDRGEAEIRRIGAGLLALQSAQTSGSVCA